MKITSSSLFHCCHLNVVPDLKQKHCSIYDRFYFCVSSLPFSVSRGVFFIFCGFQTYIPKFQLKFHFSISSWLIDIFIHTSPWALQNWHVPNHIILHQIPSVLNDTTIQPETQRSLWFPSPLLLSHALSILPSKSLSAPLFVCILPCLNSEPHSSPAWDIEIAW